MKKRCVCVVVDNNTKQRLRELSERNKETELQMNSFDFASFFSKNSTREILLPSIKTHLIESGLENELDDPKYRWQMRKMNNSTMISMGLMGGELYRKWVAYDAEFKKEQEKFKQGLTEIEPVYDAAEFQSARLLKMLVHSISYPKVVVNYEDQVTGKEVVLASLSEADLTVLWQALSDLHGWSGNVTIEKTEDESVDAPFPATGGAEDGGSEGESDSTPYVSEDISPDSGGTGER